LTNLDSIFPSLSLNENFIAAGKGQFGALRFN